MQGCDIEGNHQQGVLVRSGATPRLVGNSIHDNWGYGLSLQVLAIVHGPGLHLAIWPCTWPCIVSWPCVRCQPLSHVMVGNSIHGNWGHGLSLQVRAAARACFGLVSGDLACVATRCINGPSQQQKDP